MPIPSEVKRTPAEEASNWAPRADTTRRSVFGNYAPCKAVGVRPSSGAATHDRDGRPESPVTGEQAEAAASEDGRTPVFRCAPGVGSLQAAIDMAIARSFLYQFMARAFGDPELETWTWLACTDTQAAFQSTVEIFARQIAGLQNSAKLLLAKVQLDRFEVFQTAYVAAFCHAARGDCPLNEIEYGELKVDPLFQPHRLADLAAFYRAFGLEVADGAAERPDHLGMELEFMSLLAAKVAFAHEHQLEDEHCSVLQDTQKKFLREHLGRWAPAFARRLARAATDDTLAALALFLGEFIATECIRFNVAAGREDLLLRPVDEAAESLCASCGLNNLPPGAGGHNPK